MYAVHDRLYFSILPPLANLRVLFETLTVLFKPFPYSGRYFLYLQKLHQTRNYRKTSNITHTRPQNLSIPRLVLQLSLPNPLKPSVKSRMTMSLEQRRQAMLQLHLSDQQFYWLLRSVYIRGLIIVLMVIKERNCTPKYIFYFRHILLSVHCFFKCMWVSNISNRCVHDALAMVDSPQKGPVMWGFDVFSVIGLN